jgi:N-acetylmuramoyl-L-alanine amidase
VKKSVSIFTVIILLLFFQNQLFAQRKNQIHTIVIDAGHGGHDAGARGHNSLEKDITLAIALKTGTMIKKYCPGVQVIYTRETDVFVELYRRAQIANENKADLFISIHCNANPSPFAYGTETYVMGLHKSEANLDVARTENASILLEDNYSSRYDGFNPNSTEAYIIFSLFQNAYLDKSLDFASRIEDSFTANTKLPERGVKQAGFLVLYKTTMPGVLVETGFISNSNEESFLMSTPGQDRIAFSIYRAFDEFRRSSDGNGNTIVSNSVEDSLYKLHPAIIRLEQEKIEKALKGDTFGFRNSKNNDQQSFSRTTLSKNKTNITSSGKNETNNLKSGKAVREVITEKPKDAFIPVLDSKTKAALAKPESVVSVTSNSGLKFRVQFMTSPKSLPLDAPVFKDLPSIKMYIQDQLFKYTAGDELTPKDAEHIRQMVAGKGYRDAFVLPFLNENRITMKEALIMIKNKQ